MSEQQILESESKMSSGSSYHFDPQFIHDHYLILDTPPERVFDDLTSMAASICDAPMAAISLLDHDRAWFKSTFGLPLQEVPIKSSFCIHAIKEADVLIVPDASIDPRFFQNPFVTGPPEIRFYAGTCIRSAGGSVLGTLCVLDRLPRVLRSDQIEGLRLLARHASNLIELRKNSVESSNEDESISSLASSSMLFDFAPVPLIVCNIDDLRVMEINLSALNLYGFTREEMIGMTLREIFLSDTEFNLSSFEESSYVYHRRKSGEVLKVKLTSKRIFHSGEKAHLISIEELESEGQTPQAHRIELPMVCHELRQPLTAIHSSLGYLVGIGSPDFPHELRKILDIAYRNTLRMLRLVTDLQETSALTLGMTRVVLTELNLNDVIREAIELNEAAAVQAESKIEFSSPNSEAWVRADNDRLIQVFSNLFSNALRFSPTGKSVRVSMIQNENHYEVRVKDNGPGIPADVAKQIFEGMVSGERRKSKQGSGLGLYICKLILDALGGSIRFETQQNQGTTFYVALPACK